MARWVGIDYGSKRIGVAVSDAAGRTASPVATVRAEQSHAANAAAVLAVAAEYAPAGFVVGLPLNMDGTDSPQTRYSRRFAKVLEDAPGPEQARRDVVLFDERLSSFQADALMEEAGVPRGRRGDLRDSFAALAILRAFLDSRPVGEAPEAKP